MRNGFVYDDLAVIARNEGLRSQWSWSALFSHGYFALSGELSYRPLVTLSYRMDSALWGLRPAGYHLTNAVLHALVVAAFFTLLVRMRLETRSAGAAGLLFAFHPLAGEAVSGIGFREDVLATLCTLAACLALLRACAKEEARQSPSTAQSGWMLLAMLAAALAVLAKESAVVLPLLAALAVLEARRRGLLLHPGRQVAVIFAPVTAVVAAYFVVRFMLLVNPAESARLLPSPRPLTNLLTMGRVLAYDLKLVLLPAPLSVDYVVPFSNRGNAAAGVIGLVILVSYIAAWWKLRRMIAGTALGWFGVALLPVSNVVPLAHLLAERYLYLPLLGICMLGGIGWSLAGRYAAKRTARLVAVLGICIPIGFGVLSLQRIVQWHDTESLWAPVVQRFTNSFLGHHNLGTERQRRRAWDKAAASYLQSLAIKPRYADARHNLGTVFTQLGAWRPASRAYERVLLLDPTRAVAAGNLGGTYIALGNLDAAERTLRRALALRPDYAEATNNLGLVLEARGQRDKARAAFAHAVFVSPLLQGARENFKRHFRRQAPR